MTYRHTVARFISSSDNADYGVTLAGTSEERRVTVERDGTVHTRISDTTPAQERERIDAVLAFIALERARYVEWASSRGYDVEPARVLTPRYRLTETTSH